MPAYNPVRAALAEANEALQNLLADEETISLIGQAGDLLVAALKSGGRVFSCGNGGSMCDAMHFAEELSGRFRMNRAPLPATAISDPGHLTCVGNDFGFDQVFARYLQAHARKGDVLLAISTSGTSKNIMQAVEVAKKIGMKIIGLTRATATPLAQASDIAIATPGGTFSDRVQELHIKVIHIMIELVERQMFPENYK
jgi:D-sedoheptulose 7-phosphate isomerase